MNESDNKRSSERVDVSFLTFVRKSMPDGSYNLMQFRTKDLSEGGIFVTSNDLSLFDLGEECEILIDKEQHSYLETNAKVVRGARVFTDEGEQIISGYGLMFYEPDEDFISMMRQQIILKGQDELK